MFGLFFSSLAQETIAARINKIKSIPKNLVLNMFAVISCFDPVAEFRISVLWEY